MSMLEMFWNKKEENSAAKVGIVGKEVEVLKGPQKPPRISRWYTWIERQEDTIRQLKDKKKIKKIQKMIEDKKKELRKFGEDV